MAKTSSPSLSYRDIINDIRHKKFSPVYILSGEEPYFLDLIVDWLEKEVVEENDKDFNYTQVFGMETDIASIVSTAQQYPLFAPRRLVIVKEAQSLTSASTQLQKLVGYVEHPNPTSVLVIVYKGSALSGTSKLVKAAKANGAVVFVSDKIKEYQMGPLIKDYVAGKKKSIDDDAVELVKAYLGNSLSKVFGEIDKLILAGGSELKRINARMISDNIGVNNDFTVFHLQKALASKNYQQAMTIVDYFASNVKKNPVVMITSQLFKFFSQLTVAHYVGKPGDEALMEALKFHSPWQLTDIKTGMRNYNASQAVRAVSLIRELDCKSKGINSAQNEFQLLKETVFNIFVAR